MTMPLKRQLPVVGVVLALSLGLAVMAAARSAGDLLAVAAGVFTAQIVIAATRLNAFAWQDGEKPPLAQWASDNARLTALVYAWGAAAMFAMYGLTQLSWRHWWQYGAGMALLGAISLWCAGWIERGTPTTQAARLRTLVQTTVVQLGAVVAALLYFFLADKLATPKDDWAANAVFLAGGLSVGIISVVSLLAYRRLRAAGIDA